ncbi:MAG TPA: DNA alkylation repair protein, partial [Melioribacteraceae bacterium]|nr:DNA alkylation repair protein [Melioribacteraceae bacterium]
SNAFGVSVTKLKEIAKGIKRNHKVALTLWATGYHEARIMAVLLDELNKVEDEQLNNWALDFNSWDICDLTCMYIVSYSVLCEKKIYEWYKRDEEYVKRAAYATIAAAAVHQKKWDDQKFIDMLPIIKLALTDERNFVKKAVNWALRGIGKRNKKLNNIVIDFTIECLEETENKTARWILKDALRELTNPEKMKRLK